MKSNIENPIATETLFLRTEAGARKKITVMVGRPYADGGCFRCPLKIDGLDAQYADVTGETSLQALSLALSLVRERLESQLEMGRALSYDVAGLDGSLDIAEIRTIFGVTAV